MHNNTIFLEIFIPNPHTDYFSSYSSDLWSSWLVFALHRITLWTTWRLHELAGVQMFLFKWPVTMCHNRETQFTFNFLRSQSVPESNHGFILCVPMPSCRCLLPASSRFLFMPSQLEVVDPACFLFVFHSLHQAIQAPPEILLLPDLSDPSWCPPTAWSSHHLGIAHSYRGRPRVDSLKIHLEFIEVDVFYFGVL